MRDLNNLRKQEYRSYQREVDRTRPAPPPISPAPTPINTPDSIPVPSRPLPGSLPTVSRPPVQQTQNANSVLSTVQSAPLFDKAVQQTLVGKATGQQEEKRTWWDTTKDAAMRGLGWADQGIVRGADWLANALPRLEGAITGEDPESGTFTGAMLKPLTDKTGEWVDYYDKATEHYDKNVQKDVEGNKVAQFLTDAASGTVAALPNAVMALMSGGGSAATTLAGKAPGAAAAVTNSIKSMAKNPAFAASYVQTVGTAYDEAKADGATDAEALLASALSSAFNAAVEVGGGIETLPGTLRGADLSTGKKALEWAKSALDEGKEEVIQSVITNLTNRATYGSQQKLTPGGLAQDFIGGATVGGILGGGQVLTNSMLNRLNQKPQAAQFDEAVQSILPKPEPAPVDVTPPPVDVKPPVVEEPVEVRQEAVPVPPVVEQSAQSPLEKSFNDFIKATDGKPTNKDFDAWMGEVWAKSSDPTEVAAFLDAQEKAGKIKFHSDGTFFVPTGNEMDIDSRNLGSVGSPKVNAVQYDNPELHPFFEDAAMQMGHELEMSHPGERYWNGETGIDSKWTGVKRKAPPQIEQWKDDYHVGWDGIHKAVDDIIQDKGRENNANAKRMELILDDMMTNGYRSMDGRMIPPNRDYILAKGGDPDAQPTSGIDEDFLRNDVPLAEDTNVPTNKIHVYRGTNRSENPNERNLASVRTVSDVLGQKSAKDPTMLPYAYYTESLEDATSYANHDQTFLDGLREIARRDYNGKVIDGKLSEDTSRDEWVEAEALRKYKVLTGRDAPAVGHVDEYDISPKSILDLSSLGDITDLDAVYSFLEKETGENQSYIDDELLLTEISEEGDPFPAFKVLRNEPGGNVGTRFFNFLKKHGYDAVKYNESGYGHYAIINEDNSAPTTEKSSDVTDTNIGNKQFVDPNKMPNQSASPGKMSEGVGDMGAKTSDFRREDVKMGKGATNTLDTFEQEHNVPAEQKVQNQPFGEYTVRHMDEVVYNADLRLEQDYEGEKKYLEEAVNWTDEDVAMSKVVASNLLKDARASGDFSQYNKWMKNVREHQTTSGQTVNAWKLYKKATYEGIMKQASELLENAKPGTDVDAVMEEVAQFAEEFERALKAGNESVDYLVNLIKRTARHRRTGTFFRNRITKDTLWALDRIADYAKQDAAKAAADGTSLDGTPAASPFKVGDVVKANDRGNYGRITSKNDDGTYTVHFKSREGGKADVNFDAETLENTFTRQYKASDIAENPGAAYDFLKSFAAAGIENIAGDNVKASKVEKALDFRRNAMLSKIATVLRNLVGNGVFDPVDSLSVNIGTLIDRQLSKKTGTRSSAMDRSWFSEAKRKGSLDGLAMAIMEVSLDVDSNGASSKYDAPSNRTFKMNEGINKLNDVFNRVLSTWDKYMAYTMTLPDEFQKGGIQAEYQRGIDDLYKQGKITDDSLQDAGTDMAKYRTFQGESYPSSALLGIRGALNDGNGRLPFNTHLGDLAVPFAQVPANLASISADYSPVGLAKGAVEVANVLKAAQNKTLTAAQQAKAVHDLGRGITGTGLIAIFAALAHAGIIHVANPGDEEENKDKSAMERMQGFTGTQLNADAVKRWAIGGSPAYQEGDTLIQIGFLDPINAQMTTGALIAEDWDEMQGVDKAKSLLNSSFEGTIQAMLDLPVMDTMRSLMTATQQSKSETLGGKAWDAAKDFGASTATSFIPNMLKGVAEAKDPYARDLYSKDTIGGRTVDKLKYAIPGKYGRESLPVKLDSFGQPIKDEDNFRRAMNALINPGRAAEYHTDETIEGLNALNKETGETSIYPGKRPPKRFTVDGKEVQLTYDQQQTYQQARGEAERKNRQAIFGSEQYKALPADLQLKVQKKAEEYANSLAKASLDVGYELSDAEKELQQLSPEELAGRLVDDVLIAAKQDQIKANGNPEASLYRAMADLLKNDKIDQGAVLDHASPSFNEAYNEYLKPNGIPVDVLLNLHATLSDRPGQYNSDRKESALDALNGMGLSPEDKGYVAQALYQINPDVMIQGDTAPVDWLAGIGADNDLTYGNMTEPKQNAYDQWVKGYGVTPNEYAKIYTWFSEQKSDKDANGKTIRGPQDKLVGYLDQAYTEDENDKKIRIFMSLYPNSQKRAQTEWQ